MLRYVQNSFTLITRKSYGSRDILLLSFIVLCSNLIIILINSNNGLTWPYDSFLFYPQDRFADFLKVIDALHVAEAWAGENPYDGLAFYQYILPFSATLYLSFAKLIALTGNPYGILWMYYFLSFGLFYWIARKSFNSHLVIVLILLSYPVIFAIDRGNFAILVFLFLLSGLYTKNDTLATLLIALATSIKITPAIFLLVLILNKPLSVNRLVRIAKSFLGWLFLINFISIQINGFYLRPQEYNPVVLLSALLNSYDSAAIYQFAGLAYNSAVYLPTAYIASQFGLLGDFFRIVKPSLLAIFIYGTIGVSLALKRQLLNTFYQLTHDTRKLTFILSFTFVALMPVSADYYLLILFLPLVLYPKHKFQFSYFLAYGILLGAKNFIYFPSPTPIPVSLQVFINPLLILFLLFLEFHKAESKYPPGEFTRLVNALLKWLENKMRELNFGFKESTTSTKDVLIKNQFNIKPIIKLNGNISSIYNKIVGYISQQNTSSIRKLIFIPIVLIVILLVPVLRNHSKKVKEAKQYATTFPYKHWYYSMDNGITLLDRAEGGLKGFNGNGYPVHIDQAWGTGEWEGEQTIQWKSYKGAVTWKGYGDTTPLTEDEIVKAKKFSADFKNKLWYYSLDGGKTLISRAENALKDFDSLGCPLHIDPIWGGGRWKNAETISWKAFNGSESLWIAVENIAPQSSEEIVKAKLYSEKFKEKSWYYSIDAGESLEGRAEQGLKGFDENGNPIHVDMIWGTGRWKDENTIYWRASNGSESLWKSLKE